MKKNKKQTYADLQKELTALTKAVDKLEKAALGGKKKTTPLSAEEAASQAQDISAKLVTYRHSVFLNSLTSGERVSRSDMSFRKAIPPKQSKDSESLSVLDKDAANLLLRSLNVLEEAIPKPKTQSATEED